MNVNLLLSLDSLIFQSFPARQFRNIRLAYFRMFVFRMFVSELLELLLELSE